MPEELQVKKTKKIILSASAPSGDLTIGNYIGAISTWAKMQEDYDCFYMVADLHALTVKQDPKLLHQTSLSFFAQYLALGLDPQQNTLFLQSHVPEHAELAWILNCITPMGNLNRMTQFKEKSGLSTSNINAGLFSYPVLMAADILLYQADIVPVGEDQKQHLELARDLVVYFHNRYPNTFTMPGPLINKFGARIMSLQNPDEKMSKSAENKNSFISIIDSPKLIQKKIKSAVTDSGREIKYCEDNKGIANLMTIYSILGGTSLEQIEKDFQGKMYGHLKIELADLVCSVLKPVQDKYFDYMNNIDYLDDLMKKGALKAKVKASETLQKVYKNVGLYTPSA